MIFLMTKLGQKI